MTPSLSLSPERTPIASPGALALSLVLLCALLVAWSQAFWPVSVLHVGLFALGVAAAAASLIHPPRWPATWIYLPLALAAVWGPLQLAFGSTVYRFETLTSSLNWLADLVAFLLAAQFLYARALRDRFLSILLYAGFAIVVIGILQSYTAPGEAFWMFESRDRVIGPFVYKNQFAAFIELLLPISLYRMLVDERRAWVYALLSATMFAAVVMAASRAGVILVAAEVVFVMVAGSRRRLVSGKTAALLLLQMLVLVAICIAVLGWEALGHQFQNQASGAMREKFLESSLQMIRDRPALGWGLGNWKLVYPQYALYDNSLYANAAHNDWAQWTAEGGIGFALLLLWIAVRGAAWTWRWMWGAGVLFVLVHSFIDYPTREPVIGAILFALMGAMAAAAEEHRARRPYASTRARNKPANACLTP
jgi:O-antigen ligase